MEIPAWNSRVTRRTSSNSTTAFPTNLTFAYIYEPEIERRPPEHSLQLSSYCALQRATLLKISKGAELESHSN
jgi:hypothetical protein